MHFTTTSNPNNKTSVSLVIVQYDEEKILISIEEKGRPNIDYESMTSFVEKRWGSPDPELRYAFETSELSVTPGQMVEIDSSAWDGIITHLGRIYVVTKPLTKVAPIETQVSGDLKEELQVEGEMFVEEHNDEESQDKDEETDEQMDTQTEAFREEEQLEIVSRPESNKSGYVVVTAMDQQAKRTPKPQASPRKAFSALEPPDDSVDPKSDPLSLFADIRPEASPRKVKETFAGKESPSEFQTPTLSSTLSFSKNSSRIDLTNALHDRSEITTPSSLNSTVAPDEQVLIYVDAPNLDRSAAFRVRYKHTLEKVLKGACRNFKLPLEKASLFMVVPDEYGKNSLNPCPLNSTVQSLGVSDEQKFVISLD